MKTFLFLCFFAILPFCCIGGCGDGDGTSLIQPGESYQPTAEEQKMQQDMESARGVGQNQ